MSHLNQEGETELATLRRAIQCRVEGEDSDPARKALSDRVRAGFQKRIDELTGVQVPRRLMLCGYCAQALTEIKTMGGIGPCASCGITESLSGPVTESDVVLARAYLERMAALGEGLELAGLADAIRSDMEAHGYAKPGTLGPVAGRVITPGIDDVLEAFESEEDVVNANRELLEGRPLTKEESERWTRLFHEIMHESNKRLAVKGIVLLAAVAEPNGLGGVLTGMNKEAIDAAHQGISMPSEEYTVTITLPARERVDIARSMREQFARRLIDLVCGEAIEQQAAYRQKAGFFN